MIVSQLPTPTRRRRQAGITLVEVVLSLAIMGIAFGAIIMGYVLSARRAEWSAYSLAANSLAMQRLEQCRAAKWDLLTTPVTDELVATNFVTQPAILDVPISGDNITYATNITVISLVSASPPLKMIRVDCVWPFKGQGLFTNTLITYRAPDQ
jgi:type II secretory pathway pseudopilin PulG